MYQTSNNIITNLRRSGLTRSRGSLVVCDLVKQIWRAYDLQHPSRACRERRTVTKRTLFINILKNNIK